MSSSLAASNIHSLESTASAKASTVHGFGTGEECQSALLELGDVQNDLVLWNRTHASEARDVKIEF